MNTIVALLYKVPGSLLLGCVVALGLMQNDPWLKSYIEHVMVDSMTEIVGEPTQITVTGIDLLRGKIILQNVSVSSSQGDWAFQCPEMHLDFSWFSWLRGQLFALSLNFQQPTLFTQYDKGFAIEKPFMKLIHAPTVFPVTLVRCDVHTGAMTIETLYGEVSAHCNGTSLIDDALVITKIICTDGQAHNKQTLFAQHLNGSMAIEVPRDKDTYSLALNLACSRPTGQNKAYQLYYAFKDDHGTLKWRAHDDSCLIQADKISYGATTTGTLAVSGALRELASLVFDESLIDTATGTGTFTGELELTDEGYRYQGTSELINASYNGMPVSHAEVSLSGDEKGVSASITKALTAGVSLRGDVTAQFSKGISGVVVLSEPFTGIPQCLIDKGRAQFDYTAQQLTADIKTRGTFIEGPPVPLKGRITTDFSTATASGTFAGNAFQVTGDIARRKLTGVSLQDQLHMSRLDLKEQEGSLQGTFDSALIKKIISVITGYQLSGDAHAHVKLHDTLDGTKIELNVEDASLKIPGTYTVIKELTAIVEVSSSGHMVTLRDLQIQFHKGSAWSPQATCYLGDDGSLKAAHIPLQCKGLLISKQKELFGTLSGGITLSYDGTWTCKGLLAVENAHLRSNLLSSKVQRELMHASSVGSPLLNNIHLDLQLQSRSPIKVQTPFLTAEAHLGVILRGEASHPAIEGTIELANGTFAFPYKPLFVTQGTLTLSPTHPDGPLINLTAKNKIRTYTVTMRVTGSLLQPNVSFESSPQLSEEGIITLLLAGADHGSLTAAMPRLLMEQMEDMLFGSEGSLSRVQQIIKSILSPLKNVRLVPKDDTQEELQAVLEVDINERLRAKAQNNLQFTDETQVELEYVVSDDVSVKAVRDQAGTLGGEVEMRWKF